MHLNVLPTNRPVLGSFGKAVDGSASLNFATSGGANCCLSCRYHPATKAKDPSTVRCYAVRTEERPDRAGLAAKLARHEQADPTDIVHRAIGELQRKRKPTPWLRLSTNGSVPKRPSAAFLAALRKLADHCTDKGIPVHFPVESPAKAKAYADCGIAPRESCQSSHRFMVAEGACSWVAGEQKQTRLQRVGEAKRVAKLRATASGRKCVVCPAVAARYLNHNKPNDKAKCGNCTACANPDVDVVYPIH